MVEVIDKLAAELLNAYNAFMGTLPAWAQNFVTLFILVLLIVIYSIFIWKFYKFVSKKNILSLDLKKYSNVEHPFLAKLIVGGLYLVEYIIVAPFVIFFWFAIFTVFLIFLNESLPIGSLLIVSATIVAAIRMTSYYKEDLSSDLAKLLPFTLLATSILNPRFFDIGRIFTSLAELPGFFGEITQYLIFIIGLEMILRIFEFVFSLFELDEQPLLEETG